MSAELDWEGSLNTRFALPGLIRSANLSFLSSRGREGVLNSGVSRILDLRNREERQIDPAPFEGTALYLNLPLLPSRDGAMNWGNATAIDNADFYRLYLDHAGNQFATVLGAMHDAPPGIVLIHCHAGKDRTGLVVALAQELCGLPRVEIASDYADTDRHLARLYASQLERQPDPERRAQLAAFQVSRPHDILAALEHLENAWGGVQEFLEAFGMSRAEQTALAGRLLHPVYDPA